MSTATNVPKAPVIAADLRKAIRGGEYRPGHQLPSARALSDRYRASKGTVNAAVATLIREGLVVSRPRAGWFVAEAAEPTEVSRLRLDDEARGRPHVIERVRARPATQDDVERLNVVPGGPVLEIRRAVVRPDGAMDAEHTVLLSADHVLVYELPAGEEE